MSGPGLRHGCRPEAAAMLGPDRFAGPPCLVDGGSGPHLWAPVPQGFVRPWLDALQVQLGRWRSLVYRWRRLRRDGLAHHVTLLTRVELASARPLDPDWLRQPLEFHALGLGRARQGAEEAWFVVLDCAAAQQLRHALGHPPKDLHITLGFRRQDVHAVPKDRSTLVDNWAARSRP